MRQLAVLAALALVLAGGFAYAAPREESAIDLMKRSENAQRGRLAKRSFRKGRWEDARWGSRWHQTLGMKHRTVHFHPWIKP